MITPRNVDVFQPFRKSNTNRKETMLVEYNGFIHNRAAGVITAMLLDYDHWVTKYPLLEIFVGMSPLSIYNATKLYDVYDLMIELTQSPFEENNVVDIFADVIRLEMVDISTLCRPPVFTFALFNIFKEGCIEKLYIIKEFEFADWEVRYIKSLFSDYSDKIELIEGETLDAYLLHAKDYTTIFVNHADTVCEIPEAEPMYREFSENQLFVFRLSNEFVTFNKEGTPQYTKVELLKELNKSGLHTGIMPTDTMEDSDDTKPILVG